MIRGFAKIWFWFLCGLFLYLASMTLLASQIITW